MHKYIKLNSLTWWASVTPLLAGLFVATEPLHGFAAIASSITTGTGMTAPMLINLGLVGIGMRGAID